MQCRRDNALRTLRIGTGPCLCWSPRMWLRGRAGSQKSPPPPRGGGGHDFFGIIPRRLLRSPAHLRNAICPPFGSIRIPYPTGNSASPGRGGGSDSPHPTPPPPRTPHPLSDRANFYPGLGHIKKHFLAPSAQVSLGQRICSAPLTTQGPLGGGGGPPTAPPPIPLGPPTRPPIPPPLQERSAHGVKWWV